MLLEKKDQYCFELPWKEKEWGGQTQKREREKLLVEVYLF